MNHEAAHVKQMPTWLSASLIIACLAAAGAVGWWFWKSGPRGQVVVLRHNPDDGVKTTGRNRWDVRSGIGLLRVAKKGGGTLDVSFEYASHEFLTEEQMDVLSTVRRVAMDRQLANELGVTPAQTQVLEQIHEQSKITLDDAQRARLAGLFTKWEKAGASARESDQDDLLDGLAEVAQSKVPAARKSAEQRTALAKQTLTAEQWKKFNAMK
ncbi:MAG TPA: hypothetical protein VFC78_21505 [Tepidisphaeraceae bacterium]|nr:hypothetical protein [Tepidisphaeraceae bacterium]